MPSSCASCRRDEDHCRCNRWCGVCGGMTNHSTAAHKNALDAQAQMDEHLAEYDA